MAEVGSAEFKVHANGDDVESEIGQIGQMINEGLTEIVDKTGSDVAGSSSSLLDMLTGKIGKAIQTTGTEVINAGISYNQAMDQYMDGFTSLMGSADAAKTELDQIKATSYASPFDLDSLVTANKTFMAMGMSADDAQNQVKNIGNAVAAAGGDSSALETITNRMVKMSETGKVTSRDIQTFEKEGINVWQMLADYTGKSVDEVKTMSISYTDLQGAFAAASQSGGMYYDQMAVQGQDSDATVKTLKESWAELEGNMTEVLIPVIQNVSTFMTGLTQAIKDHPVLAKTIGLALIAIVGTLTVLNTLMPIIIGALALFGSGMMAVNAPILIIVAAIAGLIAIGVTLIANWDSIKTGAQNAWNAITSSISNAVGSIGRWFGQLWQKAKEAAKNAWNAFTTQNWSTLGWDMIQGIIRGIGNAAGNLWNACLNAVKNAWNAAKNWLGIHSPSTKWAFVGKMSMAGMSEGITDALPDVAQTVNRSVSDLYSGAIPTASSLTPALAYSGMSDIYGAQTSSAISQGIDTAAIAAAVKSGAEAANLSAYFNADKVADSTTAKTNVNMNIITKRNARYGQ